MTPTPLLDIQDVTIEMDGQAILDGFSLTINAGEVHAIMGPNGAGKSTLSYVLSGRQGYELKKGSITFKGRDLLSMAPEERAGEGLFLAFQYPVEIPGVPNTTFLKEAVNAVRGYRGEADVDAMQFLKLVRAKCAELGMSDAFLKRAVNVGFSGGEKKRNEILQMALLEPALAILDETDSGLDIDALKDVAEGVNAMRSADRAFLMITHYQRMLNYVTPDFVHVMVDGRIVKSGDKSLALELEDTGYTAFGKQDTTHKGVAHGKNA